MQAGSESHIPYSLLICLVERRVLCPVSSLIFRLSPHDVTGPRDEDGKQVFSLNYIVNFSVATKLFYEVGC